MTAPGDVLFTRGGGLTGWFIRHGSGAWYAHVEILVELQHTREDGAEVWTVHSAMPALRHRNSGPRVRTRTIPAHQDGQAPGLLILRPWTTPQEQMALLEASTVIVEAGYGYGYDSIVAIGLRGLGIRLRPFYNPDSRICSEHVAEALVAMRPSIAAGLPVPATLVWPGLLREALACIDGVVRIPSPVPTVTIPGLSTV